MRFQSELRGYPVYVDINIFDIIDTVTYRSPALEKRVFKKWDEIDKALQQLDLANRKSFSNKTACVFTATGTVAVEVTSVCEGGKEAWIKYPDGRREKAWHMRLLANIVEAAEAKRRAIKLAEEAEKLLDAVKRWSPEWDTEAHSETD